MNNNESNNTVTATYQVAPIHYTCKCGWSTPKPRVGEGAATRLAVSEHSSECVHGPVTSLDHTCECGWVNNFTQYSVSFEMEDDYHSRYGCSLLTIV